MKLPSLLLLIASKRVFALMAILLVALSCRKEDAIDPSHLDENYFVIKDNPNDPVDHSIYEFYQNTGIAAFYNDTIHKRRISKDSESPARYAYVKLSLQYSPLGNSNVIYNPLSSRNNISALLGLLEEEVVPRLPSNHIIPSILFIDSIVRFPFTQVAIQNGWTSIYGFNTVAVAVKDLKVMSSEERKMYAASILAGMAVKWIYITYSDQLQKDFFSISRAVTKNLLPLEIYRFAGIPYMYMLSADKIPLAKDIGLLSHTNVVASNMVFPSSASEVDDVRAYLTAVFYYSSQAFTELNGNYPLVMKKFNIIRQFAMASEFKLPN